MRINHTASEQDLEYCITHATLITMEIGFFREVHL